MFTGGLQRVARLTVDEYELQRQKNERILAEREQKKVFLCTHFDVPKYMWKLIFESYDVVCFIIKCLYVYMR
jgi:hypothetical protein